MDSTIRTFSSAGNTGGLAMTIRLLDDQDSKETGPARNLDATPPAAAPLTAPPPDSRATVLAERECFRTGSPELPPHSACTDRPGVSTRFETTVGATKQDEHGVEIEFSDGSHGRYDVVIGADGVRSRTGRGDGKRTVHDVLPPRHQVVGDGDEPGQRQA
jgi:hypothetical protein